MMLLLSVPSISNIYFLKKKSSILKALYIKENSTVGKDGVKNWAIIFIKGMLQMAGHLRRLTTEITCL